MKPTKNRPEVLGLLGVGFDGDDGHRRITQAEDVILVGGSHDTHEQMQETTIRLGEELDKRGKRLRDTEPAELIDLLQEALRRSQ